MLASMTIEPDSRAAWIRPLLCLVLSTIGGIGMWSVIVIIPAIQTSFGIDRGTASISYTACMLGFAAGSVLMGNVSDRFGVRRSMLAGSAVLAAGFLLAGLSTSLWQFVA